MRQFIGMIGDETTLDELALSLAPPPVRAAGDRLAAAEAAMHAAERLRQVRQRGGQGPARVRRRAGRLGRGRRVRRRGALRHGQRDACSDKPWEETRTRPVRTLSGGQQKRFALELLLRGTDEVLLLDEPDNFLDVPGQALAGGAAARVAKSRSSTSRTTGSCWPRPPTGWWPSRAASAWVHPGGFASWHEARVARHERLEERRRRWDEEHAEAARADADVQAEGRLQRRAGLAVPGGADPAAQVRGGRAAAAAAQGPGHPDAAAPAAAPASARSCASSSSWRT